MCVCTLLHLGALPVYHDGVRVTHCSTHKEALVKASESLFQLVPL